MQNPAINTVLSFVSLKSNDKALALLTGKLEICYLSLQVTISLAELVQVWREDSAEADEQLGQGQQ